MFLQRCVRNYYKKEFGWKFPYKHRHYKVQGRQLLAHNYKIRQNLGLSKLIFTCLVKLFQRSFKSETSDFAPKIFGGAVRSAFYCPDDILVREDLGKNDYFSSDCEQKTSTFWKKFRQSCRNCILRVQWKSLRYLFFWKNSFFEPLNFELRNFGFSAT